MTKHEKQDPGTSAPEPGTVPAPAGGVDGFLLALVFVAGFVLMGFEIAGSRVLAVSFGNSIYIWGSLIGVILGALGLGNWWGGLIADRWPSRRLLGALGIGASAGVFVVPYIGPPVCRAIGETSVVWGPVFASAALFLVPGILLGMVSPFAIRLQARTVESLGRTAGLLYAISTIGSFAGTFVTTFLLIPLIGMSLILKCLGGAMMVASALPMARGGGRALALAFALLLTGFWVATPTPAMIPLEYDEHIKAQVETPYHHIFVTDRGSGSRYLRFNKFIESQIGLVAPDYPGRSEYTKFFHLVPAFTGPLRRVCFIGAGGGIGPREFLKSYPGIVIDCVDIDPAVLDICRDYFYVPRDPNLRMIPMDGRMFLRRKGEAYDAVVLDAFTIGGRIPFHLTTLEFFRELRERLAPNGVLLMNVIGALEGPKGEITRAVHRTMAEAFGERPDPAGRPPEVHVFAFDVHKNWSGGATSSRNVIFVATRAPGDAAAAARRAAELVQALTLRPDVPEFFGNRVEKTADPGALLLTDDYAPIETMPF